MKLDEILQCVHARLGIESLNPMQEKVINSGAKNIILLSPTGTGKTVAFVASMLKSLKAPSPELKGVIIAPSRELVMQIYRVVKEVAVGYKCVALYGGHSVIDEKNSLSPLPDIIVATPGRLLDHITRSNVDLYTTKVLVLDEYDKSLELGFHDEMRKVIRTMPNLSRIILTSATELKEIPEFIKIKSPQTFDFLDGDRKVKARTAIVQVDSPVKDKIETLIDLLHSLPNGKAIVFVNHRESATRVYEHLRKAGLPVGIYHGALDQNDREKAIDLLNNGTTPIMVSTDLGARGLDIDAVQSIIHYHMPLTQDTWTHRNGRTARVDATGTVYVLTSENDSIPDYVVFDRPYSPSGHSDDPIKATTATLYFNMGKKEKVSRGDIAGFLIKQGGLEPGEVGKIIVKDHSALAAIPIDKIKSVLKNIHIQKLKGKSVKITEIK